MARKVLLAALSIAMGVLAPLLVAELILRFLPVRSPAYAAPVNDREPMRRFSPNTAFTFSKDWDLKSVNQGRTNNYGYVSDQDYDSTAHTPLLAVIGDSYVEALMVPYPQTLHGRLARCAGGVGRVYSFGVSGAALSQYLAWAGFARSTFQPDALAIVVVGNDFDQSLIDKRPVGGFHYFRKDSSRLVLQRLDYSPTLGRRLARHSALARYFMLNLSGGANVALNLRGVFGAQPLSASEYVGNTRSAPKPERLQNSRRVVDEFLSALPAHSGVESGRIVLVLDGMRPHLYTEETLKAAQGSFFGQMRGYFVSRAEALGYQVIDMQPRFIQRYAADGTPFEDPWDDHWNYRGHAEAATAVAASSAFRETFPGACLNPAREGERAARP